MSIEQCLKFFSLLVAFYLISCSSNSGKKETNTTQVKDSITQVSNQSGTGENVEEENSLDSTLVKATKQIMGTWNALDGEQDLTIIISKDSIFYTEHSESHKYELKNDSIFIHYPDYTITGKPLLLKDTFAIVTEDHASKFSRVKNK